MGSGKGGREVWRCARLGFWGDVMGWDRVWNGEWMVGSGREFWAGRTGGGGNVGGVGEGGMVGWCGWAGGVRVSRGHGMEGERGVGRNGGEED